ncbi:MAG: histidine triad nucleotide-binding protein [Gammaproteobacteria bacterium]|nr:histidine triad nucleotide-binding protein [Gammaproteobacteria bacterium]
MSTLFSKIIDGEIPAEFVYEDEHLVVIKDIYPKAPVHVLMIPRKPVVNLDDLNPEDEKLIGYMMMKIPEIAADLQLTDGYRTIINTGKGGGQEVFHLHIHILGGGKALPFA